MKKLLSALMTSSLLFVGTSPVYASGYTSAYAKVINNPHGALKNQISYYEKYMEEKINVGRYLTYDLNKDGTPELFLLGKGNWKGFNFVATYRNGKAVILNSQFTVPTRINKARNCWISEGHLWGGGGYEEIQALGIKNKKFYEKAYFDDAPGDYELRENGYRLKGTKGNYNKLKNKYYKNTKSIYAFKSYKRSNSRGLTHQSK